jgi:prevent-host-death family protein
VRTISQRELRNDNAEIIRGVEAGESYVVTRRGVPVARLVPLDDSGTAEPGLPLARPAGPWRPFSDRPRVLIDESIEEILDDLRADR